MKTHKIIQTAGILTIAATSFASVANAQATVRLNGQPLATSAAPIQMNGSTLVPMRDIFEALGANVSYNNITRGITARRGTTNVNLQIGNRNASVNGQTSVLGQAPITRNGVTFVPIRFVSNALGANVRWNANRQIVAINTNGRNNSGSQTAGFRTINVPAGVVVPVTLDQELTSATARVGDTFTATVRSQRLGDSEFPAGSKIEGVVSEAVQRDGDTPGVLDLDFRAVVLPDGTRQNLRGEMIGLDSQSVETTSQGRITATAKSRSNTDRLKVVGIGAGAGFLLGRVLKKGGAVPTILGALGGFLYDQQKNKAATREAMVPANSEFGVRLNQSVVYNDSTGYYQQRVNYTNN